MAAKVIIFASILVLSTCTALSGRTSGDNAENADPKAAYAASQSGEVTSQEEDSHSHDMQGMKHEQDSPSHDMPEMEQEHSDSMKMKSPDLGGTMDKVFTSEQLFTCGMHPEVVSANADTPCPLCNMKLSRIPDEKVKELRLSNPKGCPMDPIVVKSDAELTKCPVCNMEFEAISRHSEVKEPADQGHGKHSH